MSDTRDESLQALIRLYVDLASKLGSVKVELDALRATLNAHAPEWHADFAQRFDVALTAYLERQAALTAQTAHQALEDRIRTLLAGFDGPAQ